MRTYERMINTNLVKRYLGYLILGTSTFLITIFPFLVLNNNIFVISSNSMNPALRIGDLVYVTEKKPVEIKANEYDGDILVMDRDLEVDVTNENKFFDKLNENDKKVIISGLSKTTNLMTKNGNSVMNKMKAPIMLVWFVTI